MKSNRTFTVATTLLFLSSAFASETNNGNPEYSSQANTVYSSFQDSVLIDGTGIGYGSGALYNVSATTFNGQNAVEFNIATADHVMRPMTLDALNVTLHFGTGSITFNDTNSTDTFQLFGPGAYQLPEDLAWVGVTVEESQVDAETWAVLNSFTSQNPSLGMGGSQNAQLTNYGWGLSGKYLVDDYNPNTQTHAQAALDTFTPGAQANGHVFTGVGFESESDFAAEYRGKTDRFTKTTSNGIFDYYDGFYQYNAVQWDLLDKAGYGQINSGDSGGAILDNGKIIGVNTFAFGNTYTKGGGAITGEDFYYGSIGGGLAFNAADINWLNSFIPAPEPASTLGLAALGAGLIARRRRRQ